jgi:hypothetical protein
MCPELVEGYALGDVINDLLPAWECGGVLAGVKAIPRICHHRPDRLHHLVALAGDLRDRGPNRIMQ